MGIIVTRTPLRISLAGGGTDVPAFYKKHGGEVLSFTINKYVYVTVSDKFDGRIRLSYSKTENVRFYEELQHDIARECLRFFSIHKGIEITSVADVPGEGTGLGSSSSFTVGLLAALSKKTTGKVFLPKILAETAFQIETKMCGHAGTGKQDQYAAAHGGLRSYVFYPNGEVDVLAMPIMPAGFKYLEERFILLYTGSTRSSANILSSQKDNLSKSRESVHAAQAIKEMAAKMSADFAERKFYKTGKYLSDGWEQKKKLSSEISNDYLSELYAKAIEAGAFGGKLLGAGGGGFFLFFGDDNCHEKIVSETGLRRVHFKIENEGSKVVYDDRECQA